MVAVSKPETQAAGHFCAPRACTLLLSVHADLARFYQAATTGQIGDQKVPRKLTASNTGDQAGFQTGEGKRAGRSPH